MSYARKLPHMSISKLESLLDDLTRLQKEHMNIQFEISETKAQIKSAIELAQIEDSVYSGIKKFFK